MRFLTSLQFVCQESTLGPLADTRRGGPSHLDCCVALESRSDGGHGALFEVANTRPPIPAQPRRSSSGRTVTASRPERPRPILRRRLGPSRCRPARGRRWRPRVSWPCSCQRARPACGRCQARQRQGYRPKTTVSKVRPSARPRRRRLAVHGLRRTAARPCSCPPDESEGGWAAARGPRPGVGGREDDRTRATLPSAAGAVWPWWRARR